VARTFWLLALFLSLSLLGPLAGAAQDATPTADAGGGSGSPPGLDLAAMALTPADVPPGYVLDLARYVSPEQFASFGLPFAPEEIAATGLIRVYDTFLFNQEQEGGVRVYIDEFPTPKDAEAGFALFEDETRFADDPFGPLASEDLPGPGVGDDPSEITVATWEYGPGVYNQDIDATFRVGNLVAGVGVGVPVDLTDPAAVEPDPDGLRLAIELAGTLHDRIEAVLAGRSPSGADLALPGLLLPAAEGSGSLEEGYAPVASAGDVMATPVADGSAAIGYYRTVAATPLRPGGSSLPPDWLQGLPHATLAVAGYASAPEAREALDLVAEGDVPFVAEGPRERVADPVLPGAEAAVAYRTAYLPLPGVAPDGFGVAFSVGERMAIVKVVGGPGAETTALDLAAMQAACLGGGACATLDLAAMTTVTGNGATPAATEASTAPLMGATVEVPEAEHYVDLFRVDYAPGAAEEAHAEAGPTLNLVAAGSLTIEVEGPASVTRAATPDAVEEVTAGSEVVLDVGDGLVIPAGTRHTNRNDGEDAAVLLAAVVLPIDSPPPPPVAGVSLHWSAGGPSAAPGPNAFVLERATLPPGTTIPAPLLYAVAAGNPEVGEDGGLTNTGTVPVELVTLTYTPAPPPEEPLAENGGTATTPAATPTP
jgi:hypothetical protein